MKVKRKTNIHFDSSITDNIDTRDVSDKIDARDVSDEIDASEIDAKNIFMYLIWG